MRKIKFRCWDFENEEMIPGDALAFEHYAPLVDLLSVEGVMEYTGLKDKNGVEIYEGDLVEHQDDGETWEASKIVFEKGQFCFEWDFPNTLNMYEELEVVGNIYENPKSIK